MSVIVAAATKKKPWLNMGLRKEYLQSLTRQSFWCLPGKTVAHNYGATFNGLWATFGYDGLLFWATWLYSGNP